MFLARGDLSLCVTLIFLNTICVTCSLIAISVLNLVPRAFPFSVILLAVMQLYVIQQTPLPYLGGSSEKTENLFISSRF